MATTTMTRTKTLPNSSSKADFHELVDTATVAISNIVNADIDANAAIADTKLAQITTASKVSGAALTSLTSIPSAAGAIPVINLQALYPVGTIYMNASVATNPGTLFGFGTWVAIEGYVVAGYKSGDANFGTAGGTVGAATVTLTAAQSGVPAHTHTIPTQTTTNGGGAGDIYHSASATTGNKVTGASSAANAAEAHSNIQPTLVAYVWKRTE